MSKEHKYDLESLLQTFSEHSAEVEQTCDFNLPSAFVSILKEIISLKDEVARLSQELGKQ